MSTCQTWITPVRGDLRADGYPTRLGSPKEHRLAAVCRVDHPLREWDLDAVLVEGFLDAAF